MSKRMGRPRMSPDGVKLHSIGLRTTADNKSYLMKRAAASGRSMAQELESLIERSRYDDELEVKLRALIEEALSRPGRNS